MSRYKQIVASTFAVLCLDGQPAFAQANGLAGVKHPIVIQGEQPVDFGSIVVPSEGACRYLISPESKPRASGSKECRFLTPAFAGQFVVECRAGSTVQLDVTHVHGSFEGIRFESIDLPLAVDGAAASSAFRTIICDRDGRSDLTIGASLFLQSGATPPTSAAFGFIQVNATYADLETYEQPEGKTHD